MNSARKPVRVTSDPGYDKYGGRGYSRRSSSPGPGERDTGGGERERDRGPYNSKYNNHSRHGGDYKYGRAKDIRDADRDRDRSPRDRKNWDYKDKIRDKDGGDNNRGGGGGGHNNLASFGDWSEQMSSRGKKYYYNCVTDKTQWEKPSEWVDAERTRQSYSNRVQDKSRDWGDHDKMRNSVKLHCDRNNRSSQDKHGLEHRSSPVSSASLSRHRERLGSSRGNHHTNNSSGQQHNNHHNNSNHTNSSSRGGSDSNNSYSLRDWDTCRGSEPGPGTRGVSDRGDSHHRDLRDRGVSECSTGDATPTSEAEGDCDRTDLGSTHPGGAISLSAAISRISQPQGLSVSTSQHGPGPGSRGQGSSSALTSPGLTAVSPVSASELTAGPGSQSSPSLMNRLPSTLAPAPIQLTPSLSRLYKEQLIGHVLGWPAEPVERGINKVSEDANQISNHAITKVSADLKMARSLVRLAEIQATLQEQRILFLRQQMMDLERMETSWVTRGSAPSLSTVPSREPVQAPVSSSSLYPPHHRDSNDSRDSAVSAGSPASETGSLSHHQDHSQHLHHGDQSLSHPAPLSQPLLGLHVGNSVNYSNSTA